MPDKLATWTRVGSDRRFRGLPAIDNAASPPHTEAAHVAQPGHVGHREGDDQVPALIVATNHCGSRFSS